MQGALATDPMAPREAWREAAYIAHCSTGSTYHTTPPTYTYWKIIPTGLIKSTTERTVRIKQTISQKRDALWSPKLTLLAASLIYEWGIMLKWQQYFNNTCLSEIVHSRDHWSATKNRHRYFKKSPTCCKRGNIYLIWLLEMVQGLTLLLKAPWRLLKECYVADEHIPHLGQKSYTEKYIPCCNEPNSQWIHN